MNSILINEKDNVATAMVDLTQGDVGRYLVRGEIVEVVITEAIPRYHKFAACDIGKNEWVLKYGEVIGRAIFDIDKGSHVHVHNIASAGR